MFTGIIESTAHVIQKTDNGITVERPSSFDDIKIGSSISVSGVCLSVVELDVSSMRFDIVPETRQRTNLGLLHPGDRVNLERAMLAGSRLDGHVVQGHVEDVGVVVGVASSIPQPLPPEEEGEKTHGRIGRNILYWMRGMRKHPTEAEAALWNVLRHDALGVRFRRQWTLGGHILDFYCPDKHLAIEVDGGYHKRHAVAHNDHDRDQVLLQEYGVQTLRFTNEEVLENSADVLVRIDAFIRQTPPPREEGVGVEETSHKNKTMTIRLPKELKTHVVPKGSIAIDGVSLTVADIQDDLCTVALIPHTLANTTLETLKEGDRVNIETDILLRNHHA